MPVRFYMDVHVPRAVTVALRARKVDVLTAQEDGSARLSDPDLLDQATLLGRVLVSQDDDLLREAARRQTLGLVFQGVLYAHQLRSTIGQLVDDLALIAEAAEPADLVGRVEFLPLR